METQDNSLKLYSLNEARKLLGIGRSTLDGFINEGLIGVIQQTNNRVKIPHQELQRFVEENLTRERKKSLLSSTGRKDITNFINGEKADRNKKFDSVKLFDKIMEKNNG